MSSLLDRVRSSYKRILWLLGIAGTGLCMALGVCYSNAQRAQTDAEEVRVGLECRIGEVKTKIAEQVAADEQHRARVIKALDETRTELRGADQRIDKQMIELGRGQQEMMRLMIDVHRNNIGSGK